MLGSNNLRVINQIEIKILQKSISEISETILPVLEKISYELYVLLIEASTRDSYLALYLIPKELISILNNTNQHGLITSSGLYFGLIKKSQLYLSLEGAEFLYEHGCFSKDQEIHVNETGEKSVLYGNKILKKMISKLHPNLRKNKFSLIFNELNEIIAIGQSQVEGSLIQNLDNNGVIALNLVDKGYYLRKQ